MESKTIIRVQKNTDYTIINNTSINDKRLSWKAKAIHVFMLSKPDNWTFYNEEIQQWAKDGMSSFTSGLAELKKFGYIKKERRRAAGGKFEWVTIVHEVPQNLPLEEEQPSGEKPPMDYLPMDAEMQGNQRLADNVNCSPYPQKPYMENPSMDNPSMENPRMEKPLMDNRQLISTESLSTYSLITDKQNTNTENVVVEEAPPKNELQNVFEFYQRNGFGMTMNDITVQKIDTWCQDLSDELVIHAMQIAIERNRVSWSYAEGILRNWSNKNVKSIADVDALLAQFEASRQQQANKPTPYKQGRNQGRTENVPEWFNNRNQQQISELQSPAASTNGSIDFEAERQKILSKLSTSQLPEEMNGTL